MLDAAYASRKGITVGETVKLGGKSFTVIGLAKTPLGGQSSDVYVTLAQLQALSDRKGRVNTVYVRAKSSEQVGALARHIRDSVDGASVTTAKDLADRVTGSLVDAKNLAGKLGTALAVVGAPVRLPDRQPAHFVGRQACARARHAEGTRLVAVARRSAGERRGTRPGAPRRPSGRPARPCRRGRHRRLRPGALGDIRERDSAAAHRPVRPGRAPAASTDVSLDAPVSAHSSRSPSASRSWAAWSRAPSAGSARRASVPPMPCAVSTEEGRSP